MTRYNGSVSGPQKASLAILLIVILVFLGLQYWASRMNVEHSRAVLDELRILDERQLIEEKTRQEAIAARMKNEERSIFISTLVANISAVTGVIVAVTGGWIGLHQFLTFRRKENLERAEIEFNKMWEGISNESRSSRAASIAGLQMFLTPGFQDFHEKLVTALAICSRLERSSDDNNGLVPHTLGPVLEQAALVCPNELRNVSWQGCRLHRINFSNTDLCGIDFRDADLTDCKFSKTKLNNARFDAALLTGTCLDGADLSSACLDYADMAHASIRDANLSDASIKNIKLLNLNMLGADLRSAAISAHTTDWRLAKNWRTAHFDFDFHQSLLAKHGPVVSGPRVLMLLWEYPPFVSGGQWTAAFHLLRNLRMKGSDVTVAVPAANTKISASIFGNEVEVIGANILPDTVDRGDPSILGYYGGERLFDFVHRFAERLPEIVDDLDVRFDIIHAHDWLTFEAAERLSTYLRKPWIAHIHSLEEDRTDKPSHFIHRTEGRAIALCSHIVVPSTVTKRRVMELHDTLSARVVVVPNCLSEPGRATNNIGYRQSKRVVFIGRFAHQKGPDLFIRIAKQVWQIKRNVEFFMFGDGGNEEKKLLEKEGVLHFTHVPPPIVVNPVDNYKRSSFKFDLIGEIDEEGKVLNIREIMGHAPKRPTSNTDDEQEDYEIARERWEEQKSFLNILYKKGFEAHALEERIGDFSHRIVENGDGISSYVVRATGGKYEKVEKTKKEVVSFEGRLNWEEREKAFDDAALVIVPSRFEPFGMVILEAMQHGVPVLYTKYAGVTDVLRGGIPLDPEDTNFASEEVCRLLDEEEYWQEIVSGQYLDVEEYYQRGYEDSISALWDEKSSHGS